MKDYSSSAPHGPRPRCREERAGREPLPTRCPPQGATHVAAAPAAAAGLCRPAGGRGRGGGTRAAAPGAGTRKDGGARGGRLALSSLASRRPWSSTRARVLLTNGPGARLWSGRRRRLLSGLTSRAAVVTAAAAATSLSGTADTTQTQPGLSSL